MESKTSNQEIDLLEVLAKILFFLRKNVFLAILIPLAGTVIGWLMCSVAEDKSESSMMVVTNLLTHPECDFLLTELKKADNLMALSPEQRKELLSISHKIVPDPRGNPNVHIEITVQVFHHEFLQVFEDSMITYLETSSPAIKKKNELHEFYTTMIAEIDRELASLQQLKTQADPKTLATSLNPSDLYTETVNLVEKKTNYELRLKNNTAFQLVQGFDAVSRKIKHPIILYCLIGFVVGIAALMLILFIKYFWGYYRQYRQSHPL